MDRLLIKICGMRDPELVQQAAQLDVDFIGVIFHPQSKRVVTIDQAKLIAATANQFGSKTVAVFVNQSSKEMYEICEKTGIQIVQLHGRIARLEHHLLPNHYQRIYVQNVSSKGDPLPDEESGLQYCDPKRDFLMFDEVDAGHGITFNWHHFKQFKHIQNFRWFLSGGLTPKNVGQAVKELSPNGVDVSTGVEKENNIKDINLIKQFIANADMAVRELEND